MAQRIRFSLIICLMSLLTFVFCIVTDNYDIFDYGDSFVSASSFRPPFTSFYRQVNVDDTYSVDGKVHLANEYRALFAATDEVHSSFQSRLLHLRKSRQNCHHRKIPIDSMKVNYPDLSIHGKGLLFIRGGGDNGDDEHADPTDTSSIGDDNLTEEAKEIVSAFGEHLLKVRIEIQAEALEEMEKVREEAVNFVRSIGIGDSGDATEISKEGSSRVGKSSKRRRIHHTNISVDYEKDSDVSEEEKVIKQASQEVFIKINKDNTVNDNIEDKDDDAMNGVGYSDREKIEETNDEDENEDEYNEEDDEDEEEKIIEKNQKDTDKEGSYEEGDDEEDIEENGKNDENEEEVMLNRTTASEIKPNYEADKEPKRKAESESETELESESESETKMELEYELESEVELESESELELELESKYESESDEELQLASKQEPKHESEQESESEQELESEPELELESESELELESELEVESKYELESGEKLKVSSKQEPKQELELESEQEAESESKSELDSELEFKPKLEAKIEPILESEFESREKSNLTSIVEKDIPEQQPLLESLSIKIVSEAEMSVEEEIGEKDHEILKDETQAEIKAVSRSKFESQLESQSDSELELEVESQSIELESESYEVELDYSTVESLQESETLESDLSNVNPEENIASPNNMFSEASGEVSETDLESELEITSELEIHLHDDDIEVRTDTETEQELESDSESELDPKSESEVALTPASSSNAFLNGNEQQEELTFSQSILPSTSSSSSPLLSSNRKKAKKKGNKKGNNMLDESNDKYHDAIEVMEHNDGVTSPIRKVLSTRRMSRLIIAVVMLFICHAALMGVGRIIEGMEMTKIGD